MKTFSTLKDNVAVLMQRSTPAYKTKIGVWLNLAEDFLADIYDYWLDLRAPTPYDFTSTANTESYQMPTDFAKPIRIYDITNNRKLEIKTEEEYFDSNIANIVDVNTGTPTVARISHITGTGTTRTRNLKLGLIPDASINYRVIYKKLKTDMSADGDYPFTECDNFLILRAWAWALGQEKETVNRAVKIEQQAQEALNQILIREMGKHGPDFQHKVKSKWSIAHRV